MNELLWAYGVAGAGEPLPTERVEAGGLAALVRRVPEAEYGAEPLQRNLNDLGWLEGVARDHVAVLERARAATTVVPLRLCTLFADDEGARRMLEQRRESLQAALTQLEGAAEWAVKVMVDRAALEAAAGGGADSEGEGGAAYLMRRRLERDRRETAERFAVNLGADVHQHLRVIARDAVVNPAQNRELSGHDGDMVLNGAYLVDTADAGRLQDALAELEQRHRHLGAELQLSGPFPPFNFVPA